MKHEQSIYMEDLENLSEEIVLDELHTIINQNTIHFCQCDICLQDIMAITLNNIPALYSSNFLERVDPQKNLQNRMEEVRKAAQTEIKKAIEIVTKHSHH